MKLISAGNSYVRYRGSFTRMKPSDEWQMSQAARLKWSFSAARSPPSDSAWPDVFHSSICSAWHWMHSDVDSPVTGSSCVAKETAGTWALKSGPSGPWHDSHWTPCSASRRA
jgi:hypothetical protein